MKNINNKGFMLAEVIIVSAVIFTTLVGLYKGFSNTYKAYETKNSYYDSKTIYALKNMENFLIDEMILNKNITNNTNKYIEITDNLDTNQYHKTFINKFITEYNIKSIYILQFDKSALTKLKANTKVDNDFDKYIDYIIDENIDNFDSSKYSYILIAKTNNEQYSSLRIV